MTGSVHGLPAIQGVERLLSIGMERMTRSGEGTMAVGTRRELLSSARVNW